MPIKKTKTTVSKTAKAAVIRAEQARIDADTLIKSHVEKATVELTRRIANGERLIQNVRNVVTRLLPTNHPSDSLTQDIIDVVNHTERKVEREFLCQVNAARIEATRAKRELAEVQQEKIKLCATIESLHAMVEKLNGRIANLLEAASR